MSAASSRSNTALIRERFMSKVAVTGAGCWVWLASRQRPHEGQFFWPAARRPINAARAGWMLFRETAIPKGARVHRTCSTPLCVNHEHHELRAVGSRHDAPAGASFGRWTVSSPAPLVRDTRTYWSCRCACGAERHIEASELKRGRSRGCGRCPRPPRERRARQNHRRSLADRLWEKVEVRGPDDCWVWTGARRGPGRSYGHITLGGRRGGHTAAHRAAWLVTHGEIPVGSLVCHRCDNPPCCNPAHLFLGTHVENMQDMRTKGRSAIGDRNGTWTRPDRTARGELNASTKLDRAAVLAIRRMLASGGLSQSRIALSFGVTPSTISDIAIGKTWAWLGQRVLNDTRQAVGAR